MTAVEHLSVIIFKNKNERQQYYRNDENRGGKDFFIVGLVQDEQQVIAYKIRPANRLYFHYQVGFRKRKRSVVEDAAAGAPQGEIAEKDGQNPVCGRIRFFYDHIKDRKKIDGKTYKMHASPKIHYAPRSLIVIQFLFQASFDNISSKKSIAWQGYLFIY